ncbi:MAG: major capsid protein [Treponema sp.]|jgi:hypothetical protein|nr:major capsid protein [Treponema sp.]
MPGISDNTLTLTRAIKLVFQQTRPALADFLRLFWPTVKTYDTAEIPADNIIVSRKLARYRETGGASNIFAYVPGKGLVYDPPALDESTPITEELARAVTAGLESGAPAQQQILQKVAEIQADHDYIITSAIVKQAVDIMTFGTFQPKGKNGVNIGGVFNYNRDPANTIAAAADPVEQLQAAYDQAKVKGLSGNFIALVGADVLSALETNPDFQEALKLQGLNAGHSRLVGENSVLADIIPGGFKIPGRAARANLIAFDESYEDESGTLVPYMNPKGIIFTSGNAQRVQAYGGVFIVNASNGQARMERGELISDAFWRKDPDSYILRSQSRPVLVPGDIDQIVYAEIT